MNQLIVDTFLNNNNPKLFRLPYEISYEDQKTLIEYSYRHANGWSGKIQFWDKDRNTYDRKNDYFGRLQVRGINKQSSNKLNLPEGVSSYWVNWACRLDSTVQWEWLDTPVTPIVKKLVDRIDHLYINLHRVLLLVQKPRRMIPLHVDKVIKTKYQEDLYQPFSSKNLSIESTNHHWEYNRYMALKWPLTEIEGDNGKPVIEIDGKKYIYDVKNSLFAINEIEMLHGADEVPHCRGVIFIDGLINWDALKKENWIPVDLIETV
jgi:hypothetical protein